MTPDLRKLHPSEIFAAKRKAWFEREAYEPNGPHRGVARFAGKGKFACESPVYRELSSAIHAPLVLKEGEQIDYRRRIVDMEVRCRKCAACLAARGHLWRIRAQEEIALSHRTWFATFTLSPESHARVLNKILLEASRTGNPWLESDIAPEELFLERHREISGEFTKYFKRLRKQGHRFRYLLVVEAHKSGLPHYHALLHDCSITKPLVHRAIGAQWPLGFYQAKLVPTGDLRAVNYCTKYLMKSAISRVRASAGYGQAASNEVKPP